MCGPWAPGTKNWELAGWVTAVVPDGRGGGGGGEGGGGGTARGRVAGSQQAAS